ncbi:MAG: beta-ketoacyl-ACP synthase [Rhodospirillales bacterium]|nr:beta-ketoacyl-ACP synthase [Rhodospirillales bacterium]
MAFSVMMFPPCVVLALFYQEAALGKPQIGIGATTKIIVSAEFFTIQASRFLQRRQRRIEKRANPLHLVFGVSLISSHARVLNASGSPPALNQLAQMMVTNNTDSVKANSYIQLMPHTTAVNVSVFFGICGRLIPTSSACTSGSLAIGGAFEAIRYGKQTVMIAGGSEEISPSQAAVFDTLFATSTRNDTPTETPSLFDVDRDGMVIGEGAATMVLEEMEHARARGAHIHAELVGFGTNSDGQHVTQPTARTMAVAMQLALDDAELAPEAIGYVNAHGTATDIGDVAESQATRETLGSSVPISSLKSYFGHTLGACGSIEAWMTIEMMNRDWFAPTINLNRIDPECAELDYVVDDGRNKQIEYVMTNNFAFGGLNTSLIFRRLS